MTALVWPNYISPNSVDFWLDTPTRSGGQSILGNERIVAAPAARWRATMTFRLWGTQGDPKRMLWWRAFSATMGGRAGSVQIGPFDQITPAIISGLTSNTIELAFSDLSIFSDGSTWIATAPSAGAPLLKYDAARGAQSLTVIYAFPGIPQAGQYFGLGGSEMHILTGAANNFDGTFTLTFAPPLRAAWPGGSPLDFDTPRCTMRLMADDTARQKITIGGVADVTLDLVEIF